MKLIEFLGMPRAGKTTQIERLRKELERRGFRVAVVTDRERAERVHVRPIEGFAYIMTFFSLALDEYFEHRSSCDYLLMDRGFSDAIMWADVRRALGTMTQEECDVFDFCFSRYRTLADLSLFFDVPVDVSLARHEVSGERLDVDAVAMNTLWLEAIRTSCLRNEHLFKNGVRIDGSKTAEEVESEIRRVVFEAA